MAIAYARLGPALRPRIVGALEHHFNSDVELRDFHILLVPLFASGNGLVLRHRQYGKATLIAVPHFRIDAGLFGFLRDPIHVRWLELDGLEIHIPPHHRQRSSAGHAVPKKQSMDFVVDEIDAGGTLLEIVPTKPGKHALVFRIKNLKLHSVGRSIAMKFHTVLLNAKPPGQMEIDGIFGGSGMIRARHQLTANTLSVTRTSRKHHVNTTGADVRRGRIVGTWASEKTSDGSIGKA